MAGNFPAIIFLSNRGTLSIISVSAVFWIVVVTCRNPVGFIRLLTTSEEALTDVKVMSKWIKIRKGRDRRIGQSKCFVCCKLQVHSLASPVRAARKWVMEKFFL